MSRIRLVVIYMCKQSLVFFYVLSIELGAGGDFFATVLL